MTELPKYIVGAPHCADHKAHRVGCVICSILVPIKVEVTQRPPDPNACRQARTGAERTHHNANPS